MFSGALYIDKKLFITLTSLEMTLFWSLNIRQQEASRKFVYVVESVTHLVLVRQLLFDKTFCLRGVSVMISANAQAIRQEVPV